MTPLEWIAQQGIVVQSASHAVFPSLVDFIAGEKIKGSWWGHEKGREIFRALTAVYESKDVVAAKLVDGKLTIVHRRMWPALATLAYEGAIAHERLAKITQEHTDSGRHENRSEPFPDWLPRGLKLPSYDDAKAMLTKEQAASLLERGGAKPRSPASAGRAARARRR
jgi:hypothetical protein